MTRSEAALRHFVDKPSTGCDPVHVKWALDTIDRLCEALKMLDYRNTAKLIRDDQSSADDLLPPA